jgi:hypothetical protein
MFNPEKKKAKKIYIFSMGKGRHTWAVADDADEEEGQ